MAQVQAVKPVTSSPLLGRQSVEVQTRSSWSGDWTSRPYLRPRNAATVTGRAKGQATFEYHYAEIKHPDKSDFEWYTPLDLTDHFVRIRLLQESKPPVTIWSGVIVDEQAEQFGAEKKSSQQQDEDSDNQDANPSGTQILVARDLNHLLDRDRISKSIVRQDSSTFEIDRVLTFNARAPREMGLTGNRSSAKRTHDGEQTYVFESDNNIWTHYDIAEYLLAHFTPDGLTLKLSGQYSSLSQIKSVVDLRRRTLYDALNILIHPRYGFTWQIKPAEDDSLLIEVATTLGTAVSGGDIDIPANASQKELTFDNSADLKRVVQVDQHAKLYDHVVIRGDYIKSMATFSFEDGNLETGWTEDQEDDYKDPGGDTTEEKDANRKLDKHNRVYQRYRVPRDWDGNGGDGQGKSTWDAVPSLDPDYLYGLDTTKGGGADVFVANKRFLRHLPLREPDDDLEGAEPEFRKMIAFVKDPATDTWYQADRLPADLDAGQLQVRPVDTEFAVEVKGTLPHLMGEEHFDSAEDDSDTPEVFDYEDLVITGAFESDVRLQATASNTGVSAGEGKTLYLDDRNAQCWYVTPETVERVEDGELKPFRYSDNGFDSYLIRNDYERLLGKAKIALAWFGEPRAQITITVGRLGVWCPVGSYITRAKHGTLSKQVGTIVSRVSWDFSTFETTISTGYHELDVVGMDYEPGHSDPVSILSDISELRDDVAREREILQHVPLRIPPQPPFDPGAWERQIVTVTPSTGTQNDPTDWLEMSSKKTIQKGDLFIFLYKSAAPHYFYLNGTVTGEDHQFAHWYVELKDSEDEEETITRIRGPQLTVQAGTTTTLSAGWDCNAANGDGYTCFGPLSVSADFTADRIRFGERDGEFDSIQFRLYQIQFLSLL